MGTEAKKEERRGRRIGGRERSNEMCTGKDKRTEQRERESGN